VAREDGSHKPPNGGPQMDGRWWPWVASGRVGTRVLFGWLGQQVGTGGGRGGPGEGKGGGREREGNRGEGRGNASVPLSAGPRADKRDMHTVRVDTFRA
jgi:hypothetical protein